MGKNRNVRFIDAVGPSLISAAIVPKSRKPKFELTLKIIDLNNVPLVSGTSYVKWHLPHSTAAEHRGKTDRTVIKDHKVTWDYVKVTQLRVTADKTGLLQDTELQLEILQEYSSKARGERITLGTVKLNLAEYVDGSYDSEDGITRRYLMQDSKINSTLKLSICMKQIEGDRVFTAPALKTAPIFGGIAGIMSVEQVAEPEDGSLLPAMSNKFTSDLGEMQDMYRQTLTASLVSDIDDLPADECIENIFSGGDGWGGKSKKLTFQSPSLPASGEEGESDSERVPPLSGHKRSASQPAIQQQNKSHHFRRGSHQRDFHDSGRPGTKSTEAQIHSSSSEDHLNRPHRLLAEPSEFDLREHLRSWKLPG